MLLAEQADSSLHSTPMESPVLQHPAIAPDPTNFLHPPSPAYPL
ncbi:unnamed protein product, partial [Rhizoctonia solani]